MRGYFCQDCGAVVHRNTTKRCKACHLDYIDEQRRMRPIVREKIQVGCLVTKTQHKKIRKAANKLRLNSASELIRLGIERILSEM